MEFKKPINNDELLKDVMFPFTLEDSGLQGRCVRLDAAVNNILGSHKYPDVVSKIIGELLIFVVMIGSILKLKGMVSVQVQGKGAIGFISADYTSEGHLRGYVYIREGETINENAKKITDLISGGLLVVSIEHEKEAPYRAIVPVEGDTLTDCLAEYFRMSNQLDMGLKISVAKNGSHWCAGGIMLQKIPEDGGKKNKKNNGMWQDSMVMLASLTEAEMTDTNLSLDTLLYRLFHENGVRVFEPFKLIAQCRCSRERMANVLKTMSAEEIEEMKENGVITMECKFCSRSEIFTDTDF